MLFWLHAKLLERDLLVVAERPDANDYTGEGLPRVLRQVRKWLQKAKAHELEPLVDPMAELLVQRRDVKLVAARALVAMGDKRRIDRLRPIIEQVAKQRGRAQSNRIDLCEDFAVLIKGLTDVETPAFLKELESLLSQAISDIEFRKTHPPGRRISSWISQRPGMGISHYEEPSTDEDRNYE